MIYIYLHGFASGTRSQKALFFQHKFAEAGLELNVPDLNLGNFAEVTLTAQLQYLQQLYCQGLPITIIGSSLGGFLAVQLAAIYPEVKKLVLLAPAFEFGRCLTHILGETAIATWEQQGSYEFYHYGYGETRPLAFKFYVDAQIYSETILQRQLPALIIHGIHDQVIPFNLSAKFAQYRSEVKLAAVDSDHSLNNILDDMWLKTAAFLELDSR